MPRPYLLAFVLVSCGAQEPACERPTGLWLVQSEQRSGDCGELPDRLVYLVLNDAQRATCQRAVYDWSSDDCSFEAELVCPSGTKTITQVMTMTQRSENEWSGAMTMLAVEGSRSCRGVYVNRAAR